MLDVNTVQTIAGLLLAGTLVGAGFLGYIVARSRGPMTAVRATRKPAAWAEIAWPLVTLVAQAWPIGVLLAPGWFYAWPALPDFSGAEIIQALGLGLWALGGLLALWAGRTLGRFLTPTIQVTQDHRLVREGPFRWIRHPTYTANLSISLGLALLFRSPLLLATFLGMAATAVHRARIEEDLLRSPEAFGAAYEAYMARTGRFLPRPGRRTRT